MAAVFLQLLLHRGKHLGVHNGGHGNRKPLCGRDIIIRPGPPWLQWSMALSPELWAQRALTRFAKGRTAHIGRIGQHRPDHAALPYGTPRPRPCARPHESAADFADGEPLAANPLKDLADDASFIGDEVIARLAPALMFGDITVAIGRATEHVDRPHTGRVEFAPAVAFDDLGPFVL